MENENEDFTATSTYIPGKGIVSTERDEDGSVKSTYTPLSILNANDVVEAKATYLPGVGIDISETYGNGLIMSRLVSFDSVPSID